MQEPESQEPERFRSQAYADVLDDTTAIQLCHISDNARRDIHASAERHYPHEACGLLLGKLTDAGWFIDEAHEVPNRNNERAADRFILDPGAYQAVDRKLRGSGREIIGIYHSHPDCPARPSPTDLANAWNEFAYIIVSICAGHAVDTRCWALAGKRNRFQSVNMQDLQAAADQ